MAVPQGERELRAVCTNCHRVHYQNPKMVVGCIVEQDARILLCRRAIEPCKGLWTLPAGFMELQESSAEGAARETREETGMEVRVLSPFAHLDIPVIGQSYIIFRAEALPQAAGPPCSHESLEVAFFPVDEIPFDQLAFSAVRVALHKYVEDLKRGTGFGMHHGVIHRKPGAHPADANGSTSNNPAIGVTLAKRCHDVLTFCHVPALSVDVLSIHAVPLGSHGALARAGYVRELMSWPVKARATPASLRFECMSQGSHYIQGQHAEPAYARSCSLVLVPG
eukprot:jgi/Mesvir1/10087/Mv11247-RA.1